MGKVNSESGSYWVERAITCNGCKFLNFYKYRCKRNKPHGQERILSTYKNGDDYVAVLKPPDCDYQKEQKDQTTDTAPAPDCDVGRDKPEWKEAG